MLQTVGGGDRHLVILVFERRRVAAASRRGPEAENGDLRPTAAVPAATRAKTSLTRCLSPGFLYGSEPWVSKAVAQFGLKIPSATPAAPKTVPDTVLLLTVLLPLTPFSSRETPIT